MSHVILTENGWSELRDVRCLDPIFSATGGMLSIDRVEIIGMRDIFDFDVPTYHNYITAGVVHHNSSKSESLVADTVLQCVDLHPTIRRPNPVRGWYASKTYAMIGEFVYPKLEKYLAGWEHSWSWISRAENIPSTCKIHNGKREAVIAFKAYEQGRATFQGGGLDFASFDEQYPKDVYGETITRLDAEKDFRFADAITPIDPQPWFERKISGKLNAQTKVFYFPLDDNRISTGGFIKDELIDAAIAEWPEEVADTRRNGRFGSFIGTIFQTFSRDIHVVPESQEHLFLPWIGTNGRHVVHPHTYSIGSIDWGGANPFVHMWAYRMPHMDDIWYVFDEYYWDPKKKGQRRLEEHADEIKKRTSERWETVVARRYADHDPTDAFEMFNYGIESTPAEKVAKKSDGLGSKPGIELMQGLFKVRSDRAHPWRPGIGRPRLFVAERCVHTVEEVSTYHWAKGVAGKNAKEEPAKEDDHAVDALRYLLFSDRMNDSGNALNLSDINSDPENLRSIQ